MGAGRPAAGPAPLAPSRAGEALTARRRLRASAGRRLAAIAAGLAAFACAGDDPGCLDADRRERISRTVEALAPDLAGAGLARAVGAAECRAAVDAFLLLAVAETESAFDPRARGPSGGIGLLQLRLPTARAVAERHDVPLRGAAALQDVATNVALGAAYLSELHDRYASWEIALTAYNVGPTGLARLLRQGQNGSSPYARRILARWREIEAGL